MQNLKTCSPEDNFEFACKPKKSKICSAISSKNAVQVIFATHKYYIKDSQFEIHLVFQGEPFLISLIPPHCIWLKILKLAVKTKPCGIWDICQELFKTPFQPLWKWAWLACVWNYAYTVWLQPGRKKKPKSKTVFQFTHKHGGEDLTNSKSLFNWQASEKCVWGETEDSFSPPCYLRGCYFCRSIIPLLAQ